MRHEVAKRLTGGLYLVYFITSLAGGFLAPGVAGPGALDAASIHGSSYQAGAALSLVSTGLYLALVGLLYEIFAPAIRKAGVLILLFGVAGCVLMAVGSACQLAAPAAAADVAVTFLALNASIGHVALVFFGTFQLFLGYAIYRSTLAPPVIGVLIALAGVGWLIFMTPHVPAPLFIPVAVLGGLAELSLMLWLLIVGVDTSRERESRPAMGAPS